MPSRVFGPEIDRLIQQLARLPGFGPRSARRAALYLLKKGASVIQPLAAALSEAAEKIHPCSVCGNLDSVEPCSICADPARDRTTICVVEDVADLWALERTGFGGSYHVLGGTLSALDGIRPSDLNLARLVDRAHAEGVREVILGLNATVDGQTTAHYIMDQLKGSAVAVTQLAHGVPVGGELDYLDDGTLNEAMKARKPI